MLWGAFNNASLAMQTMDHAMGGISQNIANVNTNGYKRKDTLFKTVLSESHTAPGTSQNSPTKATATTGLDIFAVRAVDRNFITQQGIITPTNTWTDMGINGRGFFMISQPDSQGNPTTSSGDSTNTLYTRAGNFQTKAVGTKSYFTTAGGQYLLGWQADAQGRIDGVATTASSPVTATTTTTTTSGGGGGSLAPVYYQPGQLIDGIATTIIQPVINLPANATATASTKAAVDSTSVTDGFGAAQDLSINWSRSQTNGDNWTVTFTLPTAPANGSIGTIDPLSSPLLVKLDANGNVVKFINTAGTETIGSTPTLNISWAAGATTATTPTINLAATKPTIEEIPLTLTVYDEAFNAESLPVAFERTGSGQWYMRIKLPSTSGTVDEFSGGSTSGRYSVPVTFDGTGKIMTPSSITMGISWTPSVTATDPDPVQIPSVLSSYGSQITTAVNGVTKPTLPATAAQLTTYEANLTAALAAIAVVAPATAADLTTYAEEVAAAYSDASDATQTAKDAAAAAAGSNTITFKTDKITQFSADAIDKIGIKVIDQDGYESGVMDSASFVSTGELIGHFSNGRTRTLAMIPVASFVAADQLDPISGTLFRRTEQAGEMEIASIASQGSGAQIVASSVETSNVDLADEFTRMIITQKAYSMNATVFKTADEMSVTARDLF